MKACHPVLVELDEIIKKYPCLMKYHNYFLGDRGIIVYTSEDKSRILLCAILKIKHEYFNAQCILDEKSRSMVFFRKRINEFPGAEQEYFSEGNIFIHVKYNDIFYCNISPGMVGIDSKYVDFDNHTYIDPESYSKILYLKARLAKLII